MASVKENKVFTQKQQPLSVAIRRILARYPDGKILKELLQNAEDAGANELRLILDLRQFDEEKLYDERLSVCQGPALLAYNDAMFTDGNLENIQKTEHSLKHLLDPMKIGRFGIGFNYLTDFPWIMSGKMICVFDPCERGIFRHPINGHPVGGYQWDSTDDDDREQIREMKDQFAPFKYDNFDPEIDTHFNGTLFRFPLRQHFFQPKDPDTMLSKVTYTPQRIQELFKAFETDGDRLLLFLTSVKKVSLWQRSDNDEIELYSVSKEIQFPQTIRRIFAEPLELDKVCEVGVKPGIEVESKATHFEMDLNAEIDENSPQAQMHNLFVSSKGESCGFCCERFNTEYHRKRHESDVHMNVKNFPCEICGRKFSRNEHRIRHQTVHTKEKNFPCGTCRKKFSRKDHKIEHERSHYE